MNGRLDAVVCRARNVEPAPNALRPRRPASSLPSGRARSARSAALACAAILALPLPLHGARVLVAQGADTPRLERALASLRERSALPVDVVALHARGADALKAEWARSERGSVLVALGPRASDELMKLALPGPIVHCLAGADAMRAGAPAIASEVPADQQAAWLARLVPAARTVGILYDPALNTRRAEAQAAALAFAGYRTILKAVGSPAALPIALDSLAGRIDVLLAMPDGTVYAKESSRGVLLYSFRKRIPIVGTNQAWVKLGALYALDWDYDEVGAACAALAAREAQPKAAGQSVVPRPRVFVNTKSATHFGIEWGADVLRQVERRHE